MLDTWNERPQDVFNLLNPSFVGLLLHRAVRGFKRETTTGMPFELIFLVLPFVLHGATRNRLPAKITTTLPTWIQLNRDTLLEFGKRAQTLLPFAKEAIMFLPSGAFSYSTTPGESTSARPRLVLYRSTSNRAMTLLPATSEPSSSADGWHLLARPQRFSCYWGLGHDASYP